MDISALYPGCKLLGPYIGQDGRKRCVIAYPDGNRVGMSYPKLLMELKLNRHLLPTESTDHIDGDYFNDELTNLQVLPHREHAFADAWRLKEQTFICEVCKRTFTLSGRKLRNAYLNQKRRNGIGPFCSRRCAGIATHSTASYSQQEIIKEFTYLKFEK